MSRALSVVALAVVAAGLGGCISYPEVDTTNVADQDQARRVRSDCVAYAVRRINEEAWGDPLGGTRQQKADAYTGECLGAKGYAVKSDQPVAGASNAQRGVPVDNGSDE